MLTESWIMVEIKTQKMIMKVQIKKKRIFLKKIFWMLRSFFPLKNILSPPMNIVINLNTYFTAKPQAEKSSKKESQLISIGGHKTNIFIVQEVIKIIWHIKCTNG